MSRKFKSQASSARAASATFGAPAFGFGVHSGFQTTSVSTLSYVAEQPDLSRVGDPNLIVSLRNLGKKDSTTKSKALEELQEYVKSTDTGAIDQAVITAWAALYPRTSIDNSRRVRQLAHSLQGSFTSATTKRILPHLNKAIGPWLSGTYDNDRAVERAAQDALAQAFPTTEKRNILWKAYREALLEYAEDAILLQTPTTLSDERSTTKDDADAKYARVAGAAMLMLARLIQTIEEDDNVKSDSVRKLDSILSTKKLWEYAYHPDPNLRRACYALAVLCVKANSSSLDWPTISTCFVAKALTVSQLGSSAPFVQALTSLTKHRPSIWTTDYQAKTRASKKLLQFLARGSQRGLERYWIEVETLIKIIPREVISSTSDHSNLEDVVAFVTALREGLTSQEEPRQNLTAAWTCYIDVCFWLRTQLEGEQAQTSFLEVHPLPVVAMYVNPASIPSILPSASGLHLAASIMTTLAENDYESVFKATCDTLVQRLIERMRISSPETSKDFIASQDAVIAQSNRLHKLQKALLLSQSPALPGWVLAHFQEGNDRLVKESIDLLYNRNGKPFGAAAVLQNFASTESSLNAVLTFVDKNMSTLLESPSAERLVTLLQNSGQKLAPLMQDLLSRPTLNSNGHKALSHLLATASIADFENVPHLRELNDSSSSSGPFELLQAQNLAPFIFRNEQLAGSQLMHTVIAILIKNTSTDAPEHTRDSSLKLISSLMDDRQSKSALTSGENGNQLHARLLLLADSLDARTSEQANAILPSFQSLDLNGISGPETRTVYLVRDQLGGAQPQLSILSLVDLAITEMQAATSTIHTLEHLLPSADDWSKAVLSLQNSEVPHALSISSPLQGAVYTVKDAQEPRTGVIRDAEDFSMLFRLALYTTRLLSNTNSIMDTAMKQTIVHFLPLALQYVNEKLSLESANTLWLGTTAEVLEEAADVLSAGNNLIQRLISEVAIATPWMATLRELPDDTVKSYHEALASIDILTSTIDRDGPGRLLDLLQADLPALHKSRPLIRSAAIISCLRESLPNSSQRRLLNELVSDATDLKSPSAESMGPLVLLNIFLGHDSELLEDVQPQRLVFLMQNLVKSLTSSNIDWPVTSEIMKLLTSLLHAVQGIYGDHWQDILNALSRTWNVKLDLRNDLPVLHSSLRLYSKLKVLVAAEEVNEDLSEAWQGKTKQLNEGLIQCLQLFSQPSEGINQPRQITAALLSRLLQAVDVQDVTPLYALMSSEEEVVLESAYSLLHLTIPRLQEDLSLEVALEKRVVKLPPELIELIAATPDSISPEPLKRYLLCWQLAFDHFENASHKLKEAYLACLKEVNHVPTLLDRICDIVRITDSRPLDASKFDIDTFKLETSDSNTLELQWLATHLYYRCLLFTPSLAKAWFIEQKNRVKTPLEAWTQKHISSSIVTASFDTVTQWASTQDKEEDPITIKASPKSFELTASMAIDPESPPISIAVVLPSSYPLNSPSVVSRTRVAVSEKNWQSWLRTLHIIIFSTGSIIEGLIAFRRNVQGAIKGQGECAICYSIIGTDMQTPNKKCNTCKNTFHGSCLFRWFKSSNSSSCPLCRNNFNYA